jgi:hypothetical protein
MTEALEGGCSCGAVRYRLLSKPMFVHCCHCTLCQKQTGSAFVINALYEDDQIVIIGTPEAVSMPTESGRPHDIYRCTKCRIALWSDYGRIGFRFVRGGTLDNPRAVTPDVHIYVRSKLPWVRLPEGARAFDAYYDTAKEWPADSFARRAAVLARAKPPPS